MKTTTTLYKLWNKNIMSDKSKKTNGKSDFYLIPLGPIWYLFIANPHVIQGKQTNQIDR